MTSNSKNFRNSWIEELLSIFSILYQENIIQKEVAREFVFKNWVANIFASIFNNIYQENITVEEVLHKIFLKFGLLFYIFTYLLYLPTYTYLFAKLFQEPIIFSPFYLYLII